ncbi:hypothetical protein [Vibrio alfacsensis]|uniref:hypothetical protein n=1 Tax=Vibrio alfacsensis TaxID=1074311 RepID=UPI004067BF51
MKAKPNHDAGVTMTAQQFNELREKINELTASQLRSLQGEISQTLNKKSAPILSSEEQELLSKLFA